MPWYHKDDTTWTEQPTAAEEGMSIHVQASDDRPYVRVLNGADERLHLTGADPRPSTDTTHTAAWVPPDAPAQTLFAVHAQGNDLIFEDLRPAEVDSPPDDDLSTVQSSLNEIMIPVYIDDVISDLSERVSGLVVLHTAQYASDAGTDWTYFRTSVFENGELGFEAERGSL